MANIDITDAGGGSLSNGVLQLENGVAMDTTLRYVADQANTKSQLLLATNATTVEGTLKVKTNNVEYIDVEDGSGNNRFTISRPALGQKVALDFASNPVGSTTPVGAIRTFQDGVNLSDAMTFIEDGSIGIGATAPVGLLHMYKAAINVRLAIDGDAGFNRLISYRTGALPRWGLYADNTAESGSNAGTNFAIRRYNDAGTFIDAPLTINRANGRVSVNERLLVESDSTVSTQTSSVIAADTTNANLVIAPNGTGALIADIPDGAVSGGNARGTYAVDLQFLRKNANQVASGVLSTISGGEDNRSSGNFSTISGGSGNVASGSFSSVGAGFGNSSTGSYSYSANNANTASNNNASSFGNNNTSSGTGSFVAGGGSSAASNSGSVVIGGSANVASGVNSIATGNKGSSYLFNQISTGNNNGNSGQSQISYLIASNSASLNSGATNILYLDGTNATQLIIPFGNNRSWNVTIKYVAVVTLITGTATGVTVGDTKSQNIEIGFKRVGGTSSLVGAGSYSIAQEDASMSTASLIPTAGGSQDLVLTFTAPTFAGGGSVTCKVVAKVELSEAAWG